MLFKEKRSFSGISSALVIWTIAMYIKIKGCKDYILIFLINIIFLQMFVLPQLETEGQPQRKNQGWESLITRFMLQHTSAGLTLQKSHLFRVQLNCNYKIMEMDNFICLFLIFFQLGAKKGGLGATRVRILHCWRLCILNNVYHLCISFRTLWVNFFQYAFFNFIDESQFLSNWIGGPRNG